MGVRTWEEPDEPPPPPRGPSPWTALSLSFLLLLGLLTNGRPIGSPETRAAERAAAALAEGRFERKPAAPLLPALLSAPVFAAARMAFALDDAGRALAGKLSASLGSAVAAGLLFLAVGRRRPETEAATAAALFALGSGVWAASQSLWPHPAALVFLCTAVLCVVRAEHEPSWARWTGLPLGLAAAADPAAVVLAGALLVALGVRWPRRALALLAGALPGAALYVREALTPGGALSALGELQQPTGAPHLALLVSPVKGWLVFTPLVIVAAVGLARAFRAGERGLAATLGAPVLAHWGWLGCLEGWHGGEAWGPRLLTDALPFLLLFLPEGFDALGRPGALLAALSVAVQMLGAFAGDGRWAQLHGPPAASAASWEITASPLLLHASERVLRPAAPLLRAGRVVVGEHPLVILGPRGSRITFPRDGPALSGADETCGDVHLQGGARVRDGRLLLAAAGDALFLRVGAGARARPMQLRILGRGRGTLRVAERTFWTEPRVQSYAIAGAFRFRHPYDYPESGGPDLTISVAGEAAIEAVSLVSPGAPDQPLELESELGPALDPAARGNAAADTSGLS